MMNNQDLNIWAQWKALLFIPLAALLTHPYQQLCVQSG